MAFPGGTKAQTLAWLTPVVQGARILPLHFFTTGEWRRDRAAVIAAVKRCDWAGAPLIVRSSASGEDSEGSSQAGRFLSRADVPLSELAAAIDQVVASYGRADTDADDDHVLVQPMLAGVVCSGVAFTRDPSTGSSYLVVTAAEGDDTAVVTSGRRGETWCHYHWLHGPRPLDRRLDALVDLAHELIVLCGQDNLDFEFAFTEDGGLWLLQVRPLALSVARTDDAEVGRQIDAIVAKIRQSIGPHPFLHGTRTVYGVMPDWNPAEMIGIRPSPLALSLYCEMITDSIWAYQRHNYGYKNLRSFPLLIHFQGLPYIDVRVSFNSFLPRDVAPELADRLVDYYIESLLLHPALHDKVEFEIVFSCYTFDIHDRLGRLRQHGFSPTECTALADSLRGLTNRIVSRQDGLWRSDLERLDVLGERREQILASRLSPIEKVYWLLEDGKRYGTLPFAGLARAGFIAVQMLRSMVAIGVLSQADANCFMSSLNTVGSELAHDTATLSRDAFLAKYGHLRPGTYDIRLPRYDEAPDLFAAAATPGAAHERPAFGLSLPQMRKIESLLREHGLDTDVVGIFEFLQAAIEGRERAKFLFTRNLSDALKILGDYGARLGFDRDQMAMVDIGIVRQLHGSDQDAATLIRRSIETGRERHAASQTIALPAVIAMAGDAWSFRMLESEPNFITMGSVVAPVAPVAEPELIAGKIVCIASADPGFDWIFGHRIAGLVTAYGGANSHMAIRAAELGIPAVLGAGESQFRRWSEAEILSIDCPNRKVEVMK